jgi:hypothetical protein
MPSGVVRHVEIIACSQQCAIALALSKLPMATAASCRRADRPGQPRDAIGELARRADDRGQP